MSDMTTSPDPHVEVREEQGGRVARLVLTAPPDNALDLILVSSLQRAIETVARWPELRAVVLEGAGRDFSVGHSRAQLRPPFAAALIEEFHAAARALLSLDALVLCVVRGRCEGAGAALALTADLVLADATTRFTFADAAGLVPPLTPLVLSERLDRAHAAECLLTGRTLTGEEAAALRVAHDCAGGWETVGTMADRYLERLTAGPMGESSRDTVRALRAPTLARVADLLPELERRTIERLARQGEEGRAPRIAVKWRPA